MLILGELQRLEDLSSEYKAILILISKRIRRDLWQCGKNDVMLYKMLNECGKQLDMAYKGPDQYMEQDFTDYILSLKSYSLFLGVHLQPYYRQLGFKAGDFPISEQYYHEAITLPLYYDLTDEEQDEVIEALHAVLIE